ncbi:YqhG family protein [Lederbergia citrea]|uniref:YqhG family protein n=1 Tax=Lederbergia citrea TaxID=2833581 RepID=A0A942UPC8_9BACI|nr:YqhG family protein [Lederbergia citrea]MBS4202920.1 YqhG family protein [Lederbergia citrea]MBS4222413.1 YqhG family protein [Lederbergia citrea]
MLQKEIHQYLESFFEGNDCLIEENGEGHLTVQLTIEMDKELMNRPFYWTYLEKTGGIPNPMKVTFISDPEKAPDDLKGEVIHFGAPRLHQLFRATKKLAAYIRLYEEPNKAGNNRHIPLHPWLSLNIKISYHCDRKCDNLRSIGLNLINGTIVESFQEKIEGITLKPKIPDYCFTVSPIIKPVSGIKRIETYLINEIEAGEHDWANEAISRWNEDLKLLDHFYADHEEKPETYEIEKLALKDQYEPFVSVDIINGGIYYISTTIQ